MRRGSSASIRYGNVLAQPWFKGFKPDPLLRYQWKYYDVAPH